MAPSIYFLGSTGVITLRKGNSKYTLGGISGIYNYHSFNSSRNRECLPLQIKDITTAYHYREAEMMKLALY